MTDELIAYQEARARGGAGLIILESAAIEPGGLITQATMAAYPPEMRAGWHKLGQAAHRHGTLMFAQLAHSGREEFTDGPRPVVASASAVPSLRYHTEPRAFTTGEVEGLLEAFATCAANVAAAELDGIEISAAHGYLIEQFFTPETNRRSDRFATPAQFLDRGHRRRPRWGRRARRRRQAHRRLAGGAGGGAADRRHGRLHPHHDGRLVDLLRLRRDRAAGADGAQRDRRAVGSVPRARAHRCSPPGGSSIRSTPTR